MTVLQLSSMMAGIGARRIIYTDVKRDGTLTEPNFEVTAELVRNLKIPVIASGGISSQEHIRKLARLGVEGAIIGKALYTGDIDLAEALAAS
jgi:phosphoribosylformimino-5-aminoimidazole carboxamide ribotide isomerase